ncbi:MAG: MFS transporter, partial [Solirubrobacterales bacterium]|nr:MFS transporter [Solirubrobacterales bacterium]
MSTTTQRLKGAALILVALNLRITIAAISPLLAMIERQTGISSALAGVLTTVPVVCFGAFALLAPRLIARLGMARLLGVTMLAVALGAALRLIPDLEALFVGTAVIGAGIAVGNVLLPGLIKRDFHTRAGLMTGLYSVSLFVGAALSSGLTVPLQRATGLAWRPTLALWGLAALAAFLCWVPFARSERTRQTGGRLTLWRDRVAWLVSGFMGLQSLGYYATLSWLP